jgi:NADH-quinone oxidoreductase subunit H
VSDALELVLRTVSVLAAFLVLPLLVGQTEHKVMAHMQGRLGPMYAGGFHGWAQLVADGVKFVQKEDITPRDADRAVFKLAPAVALVPYLVALAVIPLSPTVVAADVDASVLFVLAASAVGILGTLMAGWSSANKYALLGGMRAAAQLLSYELPIVLATASVALAAGTVSLPGIVHAWHPLW